MRVEALHDGLKITAETEFESTFLRTIKDTTIDIVEIENKTSVVLTFRGFPKINFLDTEYLKMPSKKEPIVLNQPPIKDKEITMPSIETIIVEADLGKLCAGGLKLGIDFDNHDACGVCKSEEYETCNALYLQNKQIINP